tara:strand:+ start:183 stop:374 length:192 start_codon:yes stop_codon:yes gene_type:complete
MFVAWGDSFFTVGFAEQAIGGHNVAIVPSTSQEEDLLVAMAEALVTVVPLKRYQKQYYLGYFR